MRTRSAMQGAWSDRYHTYEDVIGDRLNVELPQLWLADDGLSPHTWYRMQDCAVYRDINDAGPEPI